MIKAEYVFGSFIIDQGKLITKENQLYPIWKTVDKITQSWEGEPDLVLAKRFFTILGNGRIVLKDFEQSDPERVY